MKNVVITDYSFEDLSIEKAILDSHGLNLTSAKNPNKEELKASGLLEKRSAIATITDLASTENEIDHENQTEEIESLDDFIKEKPENA